MKHLISLLPILAMLGCSQVPMGADLSSLLVAPNATSPGQPQVSKRRPHESRDSQHLGHRDHLLASARRFERQGEYEKAIQSYMECTEAFPNDAKALHNLAVLQDTHGDPTQSARSYLRAIHLAPYDADLLCDYGYSRYIHGDYVQAEETLRRAIELDQNMTRAFTNLALVLVRRGKDDEALDVFEKAGLSAHDALENVRQARLAAHLSSSQSEVPQPVSERERTASLPADRSLPADLHRMDDTTDAGQAESTPSEGPAGSPVRASPRTVTTAHNWSPVRNNTESDH